MDEMMNADLDPPLAQPRWPKPTGRGGSLPRWTKGSRIEVLAGWDLGGEGGTDTMVVVRCKASVTDLEGLILACVEADVCK